MLGRSSWTNFVHLVWSIWVFLTPAFSSGEFGFTPRWFLLTLLSYPLFLWLYELSVLAALNVVLITYSRYIGYPWQALVWMPTVTAIIGVIVMVERINRERDSALKLSHDEVRRLAALAERERIGRDLHDLLGHTLSMVALKSDLAGRLLDRDPAAARNEIGEVSRVAREALAQVRRAVSGIRAAGIAAELAAAKLLLETDGVA